MKNSIVILALILMQACSQAPIEISSAKQENMPDFPLIENWQAPRNSEIARAPAAVSEEQVLAEIKEEEGPALRRLYFRALYHQYRQISVQAELASLKSCPQFHHDKILIEEEIAAASRIHAGHNNQTVDPTLYPEYMLTVSNRRQRHSVQEWIQKGAEPVRLLGQALKQHGKRVGRELKALCEDGHSDSYFRLENMVTYYSHKEDFQRSPTGLKAMLKIPVFATMLTMQTMGIDDDWHTHEEQILNKVKGWQLKAYVVELKKRRLNMAASR